MRSYRETATAWKELLIPNGPCPGPDGRWTILLVRIIRGPMKTPRQDLPKASDRNDRLKAALQANIARRKAQAKAKAQADKALARAEADRETDPDGSQET